MGSPVTDRRDEIRDGLHRVQHRIDAACATAGRDPSEVTLVVVTKFFPASDVRILAELGVTDVGENRHQEGVAKHTELSEVALTWHFIGGLQSNKAAAVGAWVDVVHSVDRARLLGGLSRAAHERDRAVDVLVQVSLDPPDTGGRSGVDPDDVEALASAVLDSEGLRLRGVMGVAPLGGDRAEAFAVLSSAAAVVRSLDAAATWFSAGMSGDLEAAIEAGATHVRVGSAVLGNRPAAG
jgi:pyridoxal phosphate enzyme (YggS family)